MSERTISVLAGGALVSAAFLAVACNAAPPPAIEAIRGEPPPAASTVQQAAEPQTSPQEAPAELQAIPEGDILARADLVTAGLQRIETLLEPVVDVTRINEALGAREARIETLRGQLDGINAQRVSMRRLEDMRLPWLELQRQLASWQTTTRARFDVLQRAREELRTARTRWELTTDPTQEVAPELRQRADTVLERVIDMETRVRERRNVVSVVSDRIAASLEVVAESLRRMDAIANDMRGRMLLRDSPPLWQSLANLEARPFADDTLAAGRDWSRGLSNYLRLHPGRVAFLVVLLLALLTASLNLRRRSRSAATADQVSERVRRLVARPFSIAFAAALGITLVILPYPTGSAADVILLLAIIPAVRLGPVMLEGLARPVLYGVVALTLLTRIISLGPEGSPFNRLSLLIVTAIAFVLAARRTRIDLGDGAPHGWRRVAPALARVGVVAFAVAFGANVFGWVRLSQVLTEATIVSVFSALGWSILVATIAALVPELLRGGLGRRLPSLRRNRETVARVTITAIAIVAIALWLRGTLTRFQVREPISDALARILESGFAIGGLSIGTGELLGAALILASTWAAARTVRFFLREEIVPRLRLRRGSEQSIITLANYVVWGLGVALAGSAAGLSGTQLAVVIGALSVGIGFGLQTIVNNFVSGLILIFERPIKVGDTLETTGYLGRVQHIGIRASVIRSFDGAEIIVPNGDLISKEVINWTRSDEIRRAEVLVGVAYGTDPEKVLEILRRVAETQPDVLDDPEITAQMIRFGDSSLDFRLRCWTPMNSWLDVVSDLHVTINRELQAAGITVPFPQRDLHIKTSLAADPDRSTPGAAADEA